MTLTEDFLDDSLPAGWTFTSPAATGMSYVVHDSRVYVTMPAGTSYDSYSSNSGGGATDNSAGVQHAANLVGGDLDVAMQYDTDVTYRKGWGANLIVKGADPAEYVRFVFHHPNSDQQYGSVFCYARNTAGGANFLNQLNLSNYNFQTGAPSWIRLSYASATGIWTARTSTDGWNWVDLASSVARAFTPVTVKAAATSVTPATGITLRINRVVDVLAAGTTDLRSALPARNRDPITVYNGEASLPAGWIDDSVSPSTVTFTSSVMRFTDSNTVTGAPHPTARIRYAGTGSAEWGLLLRMRNTTGDSICYGTAGAGVVHTGWVDQYAFGHGYAQEINSGIIRRPIRIDDIRNTDVAPPVSPPTGLDERPYYWMKDLTGQYNMRDGGWRWFRLERISRRYRVKEWADGVSEPATWDLFDGQDEVYNPVDIVSVPFISYTRNNQALGGVSTLDFSYIEFYSITALATMNGPPGGGVQFHVVSRGGGRRPPTDIVDVAHEHFRDPRFHK